MLVLGTETIAGYLDAASERYAEASRLLNGGHTGGALYLFGYVAELVLKAASYSHFGLGPTDVIEDTCRRDVEWMMKKETLKPQGPHDILKWGEWVVLSKPMLTGVA